jgi:hypothetical protein
MDRMPLNGRGLGIGASVPVSAQDVKYWGRFGLVAAKQALNVSVRGDKTFLIERLSRLARSGAVNCGILTEGKGDGAGSQAFGLMSAICFADYHGLDYVHQPFRNIEHAEGDERAWVEGWERRFNLGNGERQASECAASIVSIEDFLRKPSLWKSGAVASAEHYLHFANMDPARWLPVQPKLRAKYWRGCRERGIGPLFVALHMRRGDVAPDSRKTGGSFTPNSAFLTTVKLLAERLTASGRAYAMEVHSQGAREEFREFEDLGCALNLDAPAMATHEKLVSADILVMSRSAFSFTASLLNEGIVLYDPHKYRPLPGWITRDKSGNFDLVHFDRSLAALG